MGARARSAGPARENAKVRKLVCGLLALLGAAVASAQGTEVPVIDNAGYAFCVRDANDAVTLGRYVMTARLTLDQVEADPDLPQYVRSMAGALFTEMAVGRAPTHVHFAMTRFKACLKEQQVTLDVPDAQIFTCLSRADIPFYYMALRRDGLKREEAVERMRKFMEPWHHPDALLVALSEPSYQATTPATGAALQYFLINACLLPPEQVKSLYGEAPGTGAPPAAAQAAPKAAPAEKGKAAPAARPAPTPAPGKTP